MQLASHRARWKGALDGRTCAPFKGNLLNSHAVNRLHAQLAEVISALLHSMPVLGSLSKLMFG